MEKKQYHTPLTEVMHLGSGILLAFGPASMPSDPFSSSAPKHRTPVF